MTSVPETIRITMSVENRIKLKIIARRFLKTDVQEETEVDHHLHERQPEHDGESGR